MATDVVIRSALPAESDVVAQLFRLTVRRCLPYLPDLHSPEEDSTFFRDRLFPEHQVWVAAGERILGYCAFREGWVQHLYVHPDACGKGIGSALLSKAMEVNDELRLWVFQRNQRAIHFYEAKGFRLLEMTDGHANEEKEPDALYLWSRRVGPGPSNGSDQLS
ncbi:GNAT family N-acetyltransferase [Arenibaculum pallidiluteum]|uniref:GNAT family N-acetyltransferase n=1 Tax=Arenibaculum pallidiluteum TaxID=2812559 RepID=UPI001A96FEC0|nr:GNAT family N-acetyltransferase [Arenibaculum pallidiluteum]